MHFRIISFLAAFFFVCYQVADRTTRLIVGAFSIALLTLILWCVWSAWESKEKHWWQATWERFFLPSPSEAQEEGNEPNKEDNEDEKNSAADRSIDTPGNEKWPQLSLRSVLDRFHASGNASVNSNVTAVC